MLSYILLQSVSELFLPVCCIVLRWSRVKRADLWYPSSPFQTRPKLSDFSGEKILSTPSFGGEVKPSVPCPRFAACEKIPKCSVGVDI